MRVGYDLGGGGVGGFESGGESNMSTLECRVVSNPPHSQGVKKNSNSKLTFFLFFSQKNCTLVVLYLIVLAEVKKVLSCAENPIKSYHHLK
jgi:hypothetical protein